jgi:hypothetical protein
MNAKTGSAASQEPQPGPSDRPRGGTDLDARYGAIGIVAVAAAVRYARVGKTAVRAPAAPQQIDQRFIEPAS